MRVLVCCRDGFGHFHAMVPMARALLHSGHEVRIACGPSFREHVTASGFDMVDSGISVPVAQPMAAERFPEVRDLPKNQRWRFGHAMFAGIIAPAAYDDLMQAVADWSPDLLLFEPMEFAAPVVAARTSTRAVQVSWGPARPRAWLEFGASYAAPTWVRAGLDPDPLAGLRGHPYLDVCPDVLQLPNLDDLPTVLAARYVAYDGPPHPLPAWLDGRRERPLFYVTLGTVFGAATDVFDVILAGLHDIDADVLVAAGPHGDLAATSRGGRVRAERWVPQSLVLERCDVVVSHCGANTLMGAAARGVPHLAVPQAADQFLNAEVLEAAGAGIALTDPLSPDAICAAATRLLGDSAYRDAANLAASQIAARPHPDDLVDTLTELARA